jgi:hypothetical protein
MSTRGRGELNSFNVLRLARPDVAIERYSWDEHHQLFLSSWNGKFHHSQDGWS